MPIEMPGARKAWLYPRVLWELIRYDVRFACLGMRGVRPRPADEMVRTPQSREIEAAICDAMRLVAPFYWKPIRCLQRSVVTARLMRAHGIQAEVVIGYRAKPFFSHAWVEVAGRVANDSQVFQRRLQVLERM
jgi:hypothetical protein